MKSLVTIREGSPAHRAMQVLGIVLVIGAIIYIPTRGSNGLMVDATEAFIYMGAAMALNLLLGFTGQISLGQSAFFGIGAYSTAILVTRYDWSPWWTFIIAFIAAYVVGMLVSLPALRIKGAYLALVTLALALVFPAVIKWDKLEWLTGGASGLTDTGFDIGRREGQMQHFEVFGWDPFGDLRANEAQTKFYFCIVTAVVIVTYLVCRGVVKSRAGRALIAVRDNETAAAVMGVNLVSTKAFVFGLSAGLTALMGSASTIRTGLVEPSPTGNLSLLGSIIFLVVMVIGGAGSLAGPVVGALLLVYIRNVTGDWAVDDEIPGAFRWLFAWSEISPGDGIFAALLILLMFVAPRGVVGAWKQHSWRLVRIEPKPAGTGMHAADKIAADVDVTDVSDTPPAEALGLFDTEPGIAEGAPDGIKPM